MAATLDIQTAAVFEPLLHPARYKGARGGRGGAKSKFLGGLLIDDCMREPIRAVCVREIQKSLEQSVKRLLEDTIEEYGVGHLFNVKKSWIETPHDGVIIFQGMRDQSAESIKSLEGYNRAWVEEAQSLSLRSLDLLRPTLRQEKSELWFSWNPRFPNDPVEVLFQSLKDTNSNDYVLVNTSYADNPWFPEVLRREMEFDRARDIEKYNHIWLGDYEKNSEKRVFKNWTVQEFDSPDDASWLLGADWGFSVDPSTMMRCRVEDRKLYIDHEVYMIGCEIDALPALFDGLVCGCRVDEAVKRPCRKPSAHAWAREWASRADSARPETISYLNRHGYPRMVSATKGPNSVKEGVTFLQSYDIIVHPRCTHTIDEFTHYSYKTKLDASSGKETVLPILEDKKNHIIDPIRYSVEPLRADNSTFLTW